MSRITESEIAEIVEAYLKEKSSGQASIQELVRVIPERCLQKTWHSPPPGKTKLSSNSKSGI
jgi:hypothetical protein